MKLYYGWVIVGTLALTETVSWGIIYYAFSVFLVPMTRELGWSSATLTGAYSLSLLISGLAAPFVGRWLDRRGPRALMTAGSVLGVLLIFAWSRVDSAVGFYLIWAGLGLAMSATLYESAFATITTWFERDRARAMLAVTVAAGFASTIFLPLSGWLVDWLGWRDALVALAIILAVLTIPPHAILLRGRPEDLGLHPDGARPEQGADGARRVAAAEGMTLAEALRDPAFRWLTVAFFLETVAMVAVGVHLIPYLTERGDGARFAAAATGLIGAAQVASRVLATLFGNRLSQTTLTALVFGLQAVAVALLMSWESRAGVLTAVVLLGAGRGVVTLMRAGLTAEFYGRAHYGAINGMLAFFLTGARALAPVGAGAMYALVNGYAPVLWGMAACSSLAALAMLQVRRHRRTATIRTPLGA
ncbi:MAG: MFS transporter [Thermomicrobiales bacterium]|nr:MFS transporter [Thermomicrobiales bacterium]